MSKSNHLSGFLYHPASQQILLQQKTDGEWTLLEEFSLMVKPKTLLPIYDYVAKGQKCIVSYAKVKNLSAVPAKKGHTYQWFSLKEISKLPLSAQTKQDLIVGRRVIDSQTRRDAGERTIG